MKSTFESDIFSISVIRERQCNRKKKEKEIDAYRIPTTEG